MRITLRLLLIIILGLFSAGATAQVTTIPVRGGEHADFTRLVIRIPQDNGWTVMAEGRMAQLSVDGPELRFDLSQTFSKIPRSRLQAVQVTSDGLEFELACDCEIRANEDIPQFLVIDILGSSDSVAATETLPQTRPLARPDSPSERSNEQLGKFDQAGRDLARRLRGGSALPTPQGPLLLHPALMPGPERDAPSSIAVSPSDHQATRDEIARELGRALANSVAIGALTATEHFTGDMHVSGPAIDDLSGAGDALEAHLALPRNDARDLELESLPPGGSCHSLELLDLQSTDLLQDRPSLGTVYGEFDEIDRNQLLAVIRHYLSIGFGAEARLGAALLDQDDPLRSVIIPISHAIDLDPQSRIATPDGIATCGPSGLLWAFLIDDNFPLAKEGTLNNLVQASEALPPPLRLHLGPVIVQRLLSQGHVTAAQRIQASVRRIAETATPELQLASVAIALADPGSEQDERLEMSLSPEISDEALRFRLSRYDQRGETADADVIAFAENRLLALRGVPIGSEIANLLARAYARDAAFDAAFALAQSRHIGLNATETQDLQHWLFDTLADTDDATAFILSIFAQRPWDVPSLPGGTRYKMASRLDGLGFPDQAKLLREAPLLRETAFDEENSEHDAGQRTADQGRDQAFDTSEMSDTAEINRARTAQAQFQAERARAARVPDPPDNEQVDPAPTAAMSANLTDAAAQDAPSPPEQAPSNRTAPNGPELGLLSQAQSILNQSEDLRERVQALLAGPVAEDRLAIEQTPP